MKYNMNERILVIDDEEALCEILKFNLEKAGYNVDCAYSAEEALDIGPYPISADDCRYHDGDTQRLRFCQTRQKQS